MRFTPSPPAFEESVLCPLTLIKGHRGAGVKRPANRVQSRLGSVDKALGSAE